MPRSRRCSLTPTSTPEALADLQQQIRAAGLSAAEEQSLMRLAGRLGADALVLSEATPRQLLSLPESRLHDAERKPNSPVRAITLGLAATGRWPSWASIAEMIVTPTDNFGQR